MRTFGPPSPRRRRTSRLRAIAVRIFADVVAMIVVAAARARAERRP